MFYILTTTPDEEHMARYERDELEEIFGKDNAAQLAGGVSVFANGGIHVNAFCAAAREANDFLMNA